MKFTPSPHEVQVMWEKWRKNIIIHIAKVQTLSFPGPVMPISIFMPLDLLFSVSRMPSCHSNRPRSIAFSMKTVLALLRPHEALLQLFYGIYDCLLIEDTCLSQWKTNSSKLGTSKDKFLVSIESPGPPGQSIIKLHVQ